MSAYHHWYVYILKDPRDNKPFYIGKGQRYRMYTHYWSVNRGKAPHNNWKLFRKIRDIMQSGNEIVYEKPFTFDSEAAAYEFETKLIAEVGVDNLCNLYESVGGSYSGEKHWNYGKKWSEDIKMKISKSKSGQKHSSEAKKKMKESFKKGRVHPLLGKNHTKEAREKMSQNHADFAGDKNPFYGKTHSEEVRTLFKNLYSKKWIVKSPDGNTYEFLSKKEVVSFMKDYNKKNNTKISAHSLFQYGKNKHGWILVNE